MMDSDSCPSSPDGSSRNPPGKCPRPLYSQHRPEEDGGVPETHQGEELTVIKVEVKEEAEEMRCDPPAVKEEIPGDDSSAYGNSVLRKCENKMAKSNVIFTANESRGVIKFLYLQGKTAKDIHGDMSQTLGDQCPSYSTVKNWVSKFNKGHFSTNDEERSGRPRVVVVPEIVDAVHNLILENRRIPATAIADIMGISRERVGVIIHEILDMKKLSAKWVPKCLTTDQKSMRIKTSRSICQRFRNDKNFLDRLVTMDETWIYLYDPETKEQSKERRNSSSPPQKKFRVQKLATKVMVSMFWDKEGVLLVDCLQMGTTINARYYIDLLDQLKAALKAKRCGKLSKGILFLQDNASAHTAQETTEKLAELDFQLVDHPPYSPDLAPSDYHLFPNLNKHLKGTRFHTISDAKAAMDAWFEAQPKSFFLKGLQNLEYRCKKCVAVSGEYVE